MHPLANPSLYTQSGEDAKKILQESVASRVDSSEGSVLIFRWVSKASNRVRNKFRFRRIWRQVEDRFIKIFFLNRIAKLPAHWFWEVAGLELAEAIRIAVMTHFCFIFVFVSIRVSSFSLEKSIRSFDLGEMVLLKEMVPAANNDVYDIMGLMYLIGKLANCIPYERKRLKNGKFSYYPAAMNRKFLFISSGEIWEEEDAIIKQLSLFQLCVL